MKNKKGIRIGIEVAVLLLLIAWIVVPLTTAKLHMKIYFESGEGECLLYYATTEHPVIDGQNYATAMIKDGCADFVLEPSLHKILSDVRFDLPTIGQEYVVSRVELTSGGLVQKSYGAQDFLQPAAIVATNDITAMDPVGQNLLVQTGADPYIVFSTDRVAELRDAFSHYTMTKFCVAAFAVLMYLFAKKANKEVG